MFYFLPSPTSLRSRQTLSWPTTRPTVLTTTATTSTSASSPAFAPDTPSLIPSWPRSQQHNTCLSLPLLWCPLIHGRIAVRTILITVTSHHRRLDTTTCNADYPACIYPCLPRTRHRPPRRPMALPRRQSSCRLETGGAVGRDAFLIRAATSYRIESRPRLGHICLWEEPAGSVRLP